MKELGYEFTKEERDVVFEAFKNLADRKKEITEEDLRALMLGEAALRPSNIALLNCKYISYQIVHSVQRLY